MFKSQVSIFLSTALLFISTICTTVNAEVMTIPNIQNNNYSEENHNWGNTTSNQHNNFRRNNNNRGDSARYINFPGYSANNDQRNNNYNKNHYVPKKIINFEYERNHRNFERGQNLVIVEFPFFRKIIKKSCRH